MIMTANEAKKWKYGLKYLLPLSIFILTNLLSFRFNGSDDAKMIIQWWLYIIIFGLLCFPMASIIFNKFHDNGWIASKVLCIAFSGWLMFTLSTLKILKFSQMNCVIVLIFIGVLNIVGYILYRKYNKDNIKLKSCYNADKIYTIVNTEVIFYFLLAWMCYLRGNAPEAYGTERFMDYGFMIDIYKSDYVPVEDIWLSGNNINYYFVGQYILTYLAKVIGINLAYSYNIMLCMLFAMCFTMVYSITNNLTRLFIGYKSRVNYTNEELDYASEIGMITKEKPKSSYRPFIVGLIAAILVSCGATAHYPLYKYIIPKIQYALGEEKVYQYWYSDATRFIGNNYEDTEEMIHEFPSYSFILGDLHAHVINTIFVLLLISLMLAWMIKKQKELDLVQFYNKIPKQRSILKEVFDPILLICAFLIGLFKGTNYWDFPIYFVICGALILFTNLITYKFKAKAWWLTALQGAMFFVISTVSILAFTLNFNMISSQLAFTKDSSYQWELAVVWGYQNFIIWSFIIYLIVRCIKNKSTINISMPNDYKNAIEKDNTTEEKPIKGIKKFFNSLTLPDLFVITIALCAFGLVLIPEYIYVVDIYADGESRSNTMFKLTYQAYILFGISTTYIVFRYIFYPASRFFKIFGIVGLVIIISTFEYFNEAYCAFNNTYHKGLDCTAFIQNISTGDRETIDYINSTFTEQKTVLENFGVDFTYSNRISSFTGMHTVLGWIGHENLWIWDGRFTEIPIVDSRMHDITRLYTANNPVNAAHMIEKYDIDYIYIGPLEKVQPHIRYEVNDISEEQKENCIYIEGYYYQKWDIDIDLLCSLGEVELKSYDKQTKDYCYLIRVDREKTSELNKEWVYEPDCWTSKDPEIEALEMQ